MQMKYLSSWGSERIALVMVLTSALVQQCLTIRFYVQPNQKRCLKHEMYTNQLATGLYDVSSVPGTKMDLLITDSKGHQALNRENIEGTGKFAVTSEKPDYYELCFVYTVDHGSPTPSEPREVFVDYRVGVDAKDREKETDDQMESVESSFNRVEDLTNAIIVDFIQLKKREQEMHDTNDSTNSRLFYQTVISIVILLVLATWQVLYLKNFFRAKKLID